MGNIGPRSWQYGPSPRTKTTEGQYCLVRLKLARLVSSLLYGTRAMHVSNLPGFENKNTQLLAISVETVLMGKSRPRKNQSERSDLPQPILPYNPSNNLARARLV